MGKVIASITTSLDGYITGPDDGPGNGLGTGGERLHYWVMGGPWTYESEHDVNGMAGEDKAFYDSLVSNLGAGICGRGMYDAAGAWGGTNPFPGRLIVLTHRIEDQPDPATGFHFVDGFDHALQCAREEAGGQGHRARWRCRPDPAGTRHRAWSTSWRSRPRRWCSGRASTCSRASPTTWTSSRSRCTSRRTPPT